MSTEKFKVLRVFQQIRGKDGITMEGGQQISLCVKGRKFMLCVSAGFPIRVLKRDVKDFDSLREVFYEGKPYPVAQAVETYTDMATRMGITKGAQLILDRAAGAVQDELDEDHFDNEEHTGLGQNPNQLLNEEEQGSMKGENPNPTSEETPDEQPAAETAAEAPVAKPKRVRKPAAKKAAAQAPTETSTEQESTPVAKAKSKKAKRAPSAKTATRKAKSNGNGTYREGSKAAKAHEFWAAEVAKARAKHGKELPRGFRKELIEKMAKKCDLTVGSAGSLYQNFSAEG